MKKNYYIIVTILIFFSFASKSYAFIPDSEKLSCFMLEKTGQCSSYFSAEYGTILHFADKKPVETDIDLYYSCSGNFRADTGSEYGSLYLENISGKALTVSGDELISEEISGYFYFKDILWLDDCKNLLELLEKRGCDLSSVRLDRKDGNIFYVIGKIDKDKKKDQAELYVDKESFLPYFYTVYKNGNLYSFRYLDWLKSGSLRYPGIIEIYSGGVITRRIETDSFNASFEPESENFFSVDKNLKIYKSDDSDIEENFEEKFDSIDKIFQ
ncbi:MAG: hypothetical protein ACQEQS_02415 [Thermodesulfobacteriota bacterium]